MNQYAFLVERGSTLLERANPADEECRPPAARLNYKVKNESAGSDDEINGPRDPFFVSKSVHFIIMQLLLLCNPLFFSFVYCLMDLPVDTL